MNWKLLHPSVVTSLSQAQSVLLKNRGLKASERQAFFHPLKPEQLTLKTVGISSTEMKKAVRLLTTARDDKQLVVVFGDYDADGVCATAVAWEALTAFGCQALPFIPHRQEHGYGLSPRAVAALLALEPRPEVIVTVDNGIVAHEAVRELKAAGIRVIITDHHQPLPEPLAADALVHTDKLCGTTVAWMLARELTGDGSHWLDLAGIATFADQVPLLGANRSFAVAGLAALAQSSRAGLRALYEQAALDPSRITPTTVTFVIAPRLNALGRLHHGLEALRLLCTKQLSKARTLAAQVGGTNRERQELTAEHLEIARAQHHLWQDEHLIVAYSDVFHEGVIGLIAGKLVEEFAKPAIVVAPSNGVLKGSVRSVRGVNIIEFLRQSPGLFLELGGHPMAAGFSIDENTLLAMTNQLQQRARQEITSDQLELALEAEFECSPTLVGKKLVSLISHFEPFGSANPEPLMIFRGVRVLSASTLGAEQQHLKLQLHHPDWPAPLPGLLWSRASEATLLTSISTPIDLVASLNQNHWRGQTQLQLVVRDWRQATQT